MKKTLEKQPSMCDMIPDDRSRAEHGGRRSCVTYNVCRTPEKQEDGMYSFDQWQKHNERLLNSSVQGHHQSNVVEYNVQRAINSLSGSADKSMLDSANKIAGTARGIDRWKVDIFQTLEGVRDEIDLLLSSKKKIQRSQMALGIICSISTECLERRSSREDTDLTLDPGQVELIKEKELIGEVGDLMCRSLCQIENQLEHNKRFKYKLEENWSDKKQSFQIDSINLGLNIQSPIIMSHKDVVNDADNTCLSIPEWEAATKSLHDESLRIIQESSDLRLSIDDDVLRKSAKRLRDQADAVDIALARFISDTQQVAQAVENDLKQVVQRLGDSENAIGDLLRVITNLEKAKMTAETRLYNRLKRPEDENCKDVAQLSLISEVKNLQEHLQTLNDQLQCARTGHLGLQKARSLLENEARIKRKTIWIDTIRCQNIRAHYPSQNILIGN